MSDSCWKVLLAVKRREASYDVFVEVLNSVYLYVTGDGRRRRPPNHRAPAEPRRPHAEPRGRLPRWDGNTKDSGIDTSSSATLSEDTHKVPLVTPTPLFLSFCIPYRSLEGIIYCFMFISILISYF